MDFGNQKSYEKKTNPEANGYLIPEKLSPGDAAGVIAPSDPVPPNFEDRLQAGQAVLETLGFDVKFAATLK